MKNEKKNSTIFLKASRGGWHDSTKDIHFISNDNNSYFVKFANGKAFHFKLENVRIYPKLEKMDIDPYLAGRFLKMCEPLIYKEDDEHYVAVSPVQIKEISNKVMQALLEYIRENGAIYSYYSNMAKYMDQFSNTDFLSRQYDNISKQWYSETVLFELVSKDVKTKLDNEIILPFHHNKSQIEAVKYGLGSNISIIQGPPGTGKTQTILNIIANILIRDKTVAIISNNNDAVSNVFEKLDTAGYGYLCASLGNIENRELFFSKSHSLNLSVNTSQNGNLRDLIEREEKIFEEESKLEKYINMREEYVKEYTNFSQLNQIDESFLGRHKKCKDISKLLEASIYFEQLRKSKVGFIRKMLLKRKYGLISEDFNGDISENSRQMKYEYIYRKINELASTIQDYKEDIKRFKVSNDVEKILRISKSMFDNYLLKKYASVSNDSFTMDSYKKNFNDFIKRYPIILSSTYCLPTCVPSDFMFDYILIDEASQSMISTVLPSLAKGHHLIVIGDDEQLPPVVGSELKMVEEALFSDIGLPSSYRDNGKSFLSFVEKATEGKIHKTLLCEHYRCARPIVDFCNKRIYDEKLEIKKEPDEGKHLLLLKTVPGNHARRNDNGGSGLYNEREIEEIIQLLPELPKDKTIGIITPYRRQAELLQRKVPSYIDVGTIHTFQGREKDIIIFSSVANDTKDYLKDEELVKAFVNDEHLINVAVTRAKELFILVTSDKIANSNQGVLADLCKYIRYETNSTYKEGEICSVFDILYDDYNNIREKIKSPEVLSEAVFEQLLKKVLENDEFRSLEYSKHITLSDFLIINQQLYSKEEYRYLSHPWTHVDFLIFSKYDKIPVLGIEVDGISYHEQNEKQLNHDQIKNKAFENVNLPLIRLKTNGSNEYNKIVEALTAILE